MKMLENKDINNSLNNSTEKEVDENSEFVELDPTGRYGRVIYLLIIIHTRFYFYFTYFILNS